MENHLHEWAHLLLRWIHFIVGVAWIGASFYFNWLENRLDRRAPRPGVAGDLWAVHGGGFYHLQKFETAPDALPPQLHWFKWEAYTTWLSGFALLVMVYYMNAAAFLLDADATVELNAWQGIAIGVGALVVSWLAYDALCRSRLRRAPLQLAAVVFACLTALAWALSELLSGRAAYIHTGAAIGSIMVGNVLFVIIPAQNKMVAALTAGRAVDPARGAAALLRSRHNNYLTLPVLFIMVSVHFPATYAHAWNWAILAAIGAAGWLARHYFNVRHLRRRAAVWLLVAGFAILAATAWVTAPRLSVGPVGTAGPVPGQHAAANAAADSAEHIPAPALADITVIVQTRCAACHARQPSQAGFYAPPAGIALESAAAVQRYAPRIFATTVATRSMPIGNLTAMTEAERALIAAWYTARAAIDTAAKTTAETAAKTATDTAAETTAESATQSPP